MRRWSNFNAIEVPMFWGLHDFLCYQSKDGGLWKYPFWIQGSCETWWKWQCFHSFFRGEVKMYFGNWFYCVRKPRRNSLKTSYIKRKGVLTWKCVVKACTSYTFKNFCRIYVWFSSSLIYLGNIRKKKKKKGRPDIFRIPDTYTKQSVFLSYL